MFSDPQSITYATVAKTLPAISRGPDASIYRLNDSGVEYQLTLSHQFAKRSRCVARLTRTSAVTDPLVPANNIVGSMSATFTIDFGNQGLTLTDAQNMGNALVAFLTSGNILKLVAGET